MCGIAGYFGNSALDPNCLKWASQALKHRGPDDEGFYTNKFQDNNVALVHRRLRIIDLEERSNQPFIFNHTVLIFTGEIYNFKEIRKQL